MTITIVTHTGLRFCGVNILDLLRSLPAKLEAELSNTCSCWKVFAFGTTRL